MALVIRTTFPNSTGAGLRDLTKPSGTQQDDLLLLLTVTPTDVVITPPGGFQLVPGAEITGTTTTRVYQKIAGANEPDRYWVNVESGDVFCAMIAVGSNASLQAKVHQVAAAFNDSASSSKVWSGVTNSVGDTLLLCFGGFGSNAASTPHAGMVERWDTGNPRGYLMTQAVVASGATGTRTATGTSVANQRCITISLFETTGYALDYDPGVQVTEFPTFAELRGEGVYVSQFGVLAEIGAIGIYATQFPVFVEFEEIVQQGKRSKFYIDDVELPNPIRVTVDSHPVVVVNVSASGRVHFDFKTTAVQKKVHTVEVEWSFLTAAERNLVREAWEKTALDYTSLKMEMIGLWVINEEGGIHRFNTMNVISAPNTPVQESYSMGYLHTFDRSVFGPMLYNLKASFLTKPEIQAVADEPYVTPIPGEVWEIEGLIAAYEPVNAATIEASYINLANPGTFDAVPSGTPPALDEGWVFPNSLAVYLDTGIAAEAGWSMIIQYTANVAVTFGAALAGAVTTDGSSGVFAMSQVYVSEGFNNRTYNSGSAITVSPASFIGVRAVAGQQGFIDGSEDGGEIVSPLPMATKPIYIGCTNGSSGPINPWNGMIKKVYIYDRTLTDAEVLLISLAA